MLVQWPDQFGTLGPAVWKVHRLRHCFCCPDPHTCCCCILFQVSEARDFMQEQRWLCCAHGRKADADSDAAAAGPCRPLQAGTDEPLQAAECRRWSPPGARAPVGFWQPGGYWCAPCAGASGCESLPGSLSVCFCWCDGKKIMITTR